jgi:hypothetical protein
MSWVSSSLHRGCPLGSSVLTQSHSCCEGGLCVNPLCPQPIPPPGQCTLLLEELRASSLGQGLSVCFRNILLSHSHSVPFLHLQGQCVSAVMQPVSCKVVRYYHSTDDKTEVQESHMTCSGSNG